MSSAAFRWRLQRDRRLHSSALLEAENRRSQALSRGFRGYLLEKRETSFRSENEPDLFKVPRVCDFHIAFAAVDKSYLFPDSFDERRVVG